MQEFARKDGQNSSTHLITESMSTDDNRLDPTWDRFRYPLNDDRFSEDSSVEDVSDLFDD
jgi:hypothetical protein